MPQNFLYDLADTPNMRRRIETIGIILFFVLPPLAAAAPAEKKGEAKGAATSAPAEAAKAPSEHLCAVDVFYTWKRLPPPKTADSKPKGRGAKADEPAQPDDVFVDRVEERAATQAEAQVAIKDRFAEAQRNARLECEKAHQDLSGCIAATVRSAQSDYGFYDYTMRKAFFDAVRSDCELQAGICVSTRVSEMECRETTPVAADAATSAAPAEAEKTPSAKAKK